MHELEAENTELELICADLALENTAIKDSQPKTPTPSAKREATRIMTEERGVGTGG